VNRRVLITGGTGFVGSHAVEAFAATGWEVRALVRDPSRIGWRRGVRVEVVRGALTDRDSLAEAVRECDLVIHCAGLTKALREADYHRVNATAVGEFATLAREAGVKRFVLCSSQAAAGPSRTGSATTEDEEPNPISAYGRSKLAGERHLCEAAGEMQWIILRPPGIMGPRDEQFVPLFRAVVRYGIYPRFGRGGQRYGFVSVHDVVRALVVAGEASSGVNETYFVCNDEPVAWEDASRIIAECANRRARAVRLPRALLHVAGAVSDSWAWMRGKPALLSGDKIREILAPGWICSPAKIRRAWSFACEWSLDATIRDTYESYRAERRL